MPRAALLFLLVVCAGCVPKPSTYRLRGPIVVPPRVVNPELSRSTFAAGIPAGDGPCHLESDAIRIRRTGRTLRVTVDRDALLKQPPGWLGDWGLRSEAEGCAGSGLGDALAHRVVQSLPLDSAAAARLLQANTVLAGFVELGPDNRIEVRSPVLAPGATEGTLEVQKVVGAAGGLTVELRSPNIIGFETAWYGVARNASSAGYHFVPLYADRTVQGVAEPRSVPSMDLLQFPPGAAFFRLFYKGDDNGVRAIVIAGSTREELDRRTKIVGLDTAACEKTGGMCLLLPRQVGVNPFLVAAVNGRDVAVPLRSTVGAAIRAAGAGAPEAVLATLAVSKRYSDRVVPVEFDRTSPEILNLQLLGGEKISW